MFTILSLSDIHLGHRNTKSEHIINNLNRYVSNDNVLASVDLLILAGDVFDSQLVMSQDDVPMIELWVAKLLTLCAKHNVVVRVLEGTPSHDRNQSQCFVTIENILRRNENHYVDLQYVSLLSIEYIERFNINVLYVPDEWSSTTDQTQSEVREVLESRNLNKVDLTILHGTFEHQIPGHSKAQKHSNQFYSSITNLVVLAGHIHQHSIIDNIVSHGSFDRLNHGDECDKGVVKVTVEDNKTYTVDFIVNKEAKIYKTIVSKKEELETVLQRLLPYVNKIPIDSNIRVMCHKDDPIYNEIGLLKRKWHSFNWSISPIKEEEDAVIMVDDKPTYEPIIINERNIAELIKDKLLKRGISSNVMETGMVILKEVI